MNPNDGSSAPSEAMQARMKRLESGALGREARTVAAMIEIYCRVRAPTGVDTLAAMKRLACCPFGEHKPVCAKCRVHCYKPAMREQISAVMRFAGPRVMFSHPLLALEHLWKSLTVTPPEKPRARQARGRADQKAPRS